MSLDSLLLALEREAEDEITRIEQEHADQAAAVRTGAAREATRVEAQIIAAAMAAAHAEAALTIAAARMAAAAEARRARAEVVSQLVDAVRARLAGLRDGPHYRATLGLLLDEALTAVPGPGRRTVLVDPLDALLIRDLLDERSLDLPVGATLSTAGGLALATDDGRLLRNTVEERLAVTVPQLRRLVAVAADGPVR